MRVDTQALGGNPAAWNAQSDSGLSGATPPPLPLAAHELRCSGRYAAVSDTGVPAPLRSLDMITNIVVAIRLQRKLSAISNAQYKLSCKFLKCLGAYINAIFPSVLDFIMQCTFSFYRQSFQGQLSWLL